MKGYYIPSGYMGLIGGRYMLFATETEYMEYQGGENMSYPKWVFSPREDVTRNNIIEYDRKKEAFYAKCEEIDPNYYHLGLRERQIVRDKAEELLGYRI